jgi:prolyl oligopeptidase
VSVGHYPEAARTDDADDLHGVVVPDPYRWLEDPDDERTKEWARAQDALLDDARATWTTASHWSTRLAELLAAGGITAPIWRGERQFFMRRTADQEMATLLTIDPDGTERVLLDPMELDPTGLTTVDSWQPSKEGHLLAYQLSEGGTEESVLRVMDVASGEIVDGPIDRARYSPVAFLPGGEAYYYVRRLAPDLVPDGEEQFHRRVWLHELGTDPDADIEIFGDGLLATNYYGVSVSRDGRWLQISASEGTAPRNDLWIADLSQSAASAPDLRPLQVGVDAQTGVEFGRDGRMYVFTDLGAPRGRLCLADPDQPDPDAWVDLVPEHPVAVLEGFAILDGSALAEPELLVNLTEHAVGSVQRHRLADGALLGALDLPGLGTVGGIIERPEGGHEAWFVYTDHTSPTTVHRYDATTGDVTVWATAPGQVEVPEVSTRLVSYPSTDGTTVRMFVIAPTEAPDRPRPTILYGYGGFGVPLTPGFSASILAWVEAGGVYVVANLRGGSEEGEDWHRAGMLGNKQNVFDDLHAAAEHLIAGGWTTADRLGISGGSNGGLLVGAALTQRPDLYRAVVCSAPLLDMVRYERFGLGATWNVEYGTADDPEQFGWLHAYSPYHRVREGTRYPATLFTVFDGDTRVDPLHARKMAAALQHATTAPLDEQPILIRAEGDVGHGARSLSRTIGLSVDTMAFLAHELGLDAPEAG